jgi:SAM-dependent methyltransferase
MDICALPPTLPSFDRITGNLSFMFFRPNRFEALQSLVSHLKPGGQIVLTFPSLGTFDSLWQRIDREMAHRHLVHERQVLADYVAERPSAQHVTQWLEELKLEHIVVTEDPLEVTTGPGPAFLHHPLLRGGFLDDVYEGFEDQALAEKVMAAVSNDLASFVPLLALRCTMSAWKTQDS